MIANRMLAVRYSREDRGDSSRVFGWKFLHRTKPIITADEITATRKYFGRVFLIAVIVRSMRRTEMQSWDIAAIRIDIGRTRQPAAAMGISTSGVYFPVIFIMSIAVRVGNCVIVTDTRAR